MLFTMSVLQNTVILDRLLAVAQLFTEDSERELGKLGLTTARTHVLWVLHHGGPSTQRALADVLAVTPRNVTGLVDGLEATGYVRRAPHPDDRRAVLVTLTERGTVVMEKMAADHAALADSLMAGLDDTDRGGLDRGLIHVIHRLEALIVEARGTPEQDGAA